MPRQKLIYGRPELRPPAALVEAVRQADVEAVAGHLAQDAKWAWADGLLPLACRVPGYEGHGGRINATDKCEAERAVIVGLFVAAGAPPTLRNNRKVTPLHMACRFDLPHVAARLIGLGAELNAYDVARETPLFRAVNLGYPECARMLLGAGADANFANRRGETPLHRAAMRGKRLLVPLLLAAGGRPQTLDRRGKAPLDHARNKQIRAALQAAIDATAERLPKDPL